MDRQIVYPGAIPLDSDLLLVQRHVMKTVGALARVVLGDAPVVDGLACSSGGGGFNVVVGPGSMSSLVAVDTTAFGSLGADGTPLVRMARLASATNVALGGPADPAHVVCWLVQARVSEVDTGLVALPYWNAANPAVAFSGPGNSGLAQYTARSLQVAIGAKASGPVAVGSSVVPDPDPGWIGLHLVTTRYGQPAIGAGDIVPYYAVPRCRFTLPAMPPGFSRQEVFASSGTWRAPDGVTRIRVRVVGGGGGGGAGDASFSGGGGGAGGYAEALAGVRPGLDYWVAVGAGGPGGGPGSSGQDGGDSSFQGVCAATGGGGGGAHNPDVHGGGPGRGAGSGLLQSGGWGGDGANAAAVPAGNGGASAFGGGGRGASMGGAPTYGIAAGSGGGGGYGTPSSGGAGANGLVVIEY